LQVLFRLFMSRDLVNPVWQHPGRWLTFALILLPTKGNVPMKRSLIVLTLVVVALVPALLGCTPAPEELGALPTLIELPTETETLIPTETLTPSPTETATNTEIPSDTPTPTQSLTATVDTTGTAVSLTTVALAEQDMTSTAIADLSQQVQQTQTALAASNAASTANPVATGTVTLGPDAPRINVFEADPSTAAVGASIILRWDTIADVVRVERLNINGQVVQTFSVTPIGQLPVTIPANEGNTITYRLTGIRGVQEVSAVVTVAVSDGTIPIGTPATPVIPATPGTGTPGGVTNCSVNWFFGNEFAPTEAGCPTAPAIQVAGAYQPFERGLMIYLAYPPATVGTVYALVNDPAQPTQGSVSQYTNGWDNTSTFASYGCASAPPAGLYEPQLMLAWAYCTQLAPGGFWSTVLGYATNLIDTSQRNVQFDASGAVYVDVPDAFGTTTSIYRIVPVSQGQLSSQWTRIR
jgi:hypothetical protein